MKKWIAMLLVVLTVFGTMGMASAEFSDGKQIDKNLKSAVEAMSEKGIINGFEDGTFRPQGTLTRAQAAKIICATILGADKVDAINPDPAGFSDVPASHWAAKVINYCAAKGVVSGVGGGKFNPDGKLTDLAFGKMLLVTYGHKADAEGLTGAKWAENTKALLEKESRNYKLSLDGGEITREEACRMAYNFTFKAADSSAYQETEASILKEKELFKTHGRTYLSDTGLSLDFAGSAVEFEAEFGGDLTMRYNADVDCYFTTIVDGREYARTVAKVGTDKALCVAPDVFPGKHTVRIVRDSDATKKGEDMELISVSFKGIKSTMKAPAEKELLIEFVGDSITAGKYTQMDADGDGIHKGTNSYAYLTAEALKADYSMLCRGGCGYFKVSTCPKTMNELYPYYNGFEETPIAYTTQRKADVVVIAMGTNDGADIVKENYENGRIPFADVKEATKNLVGQVRAMHGEDVKIVLLYNMMAGNWQTEFKAVAKELGIYILKTTRDNAGGNNHPSKEAHEVIAKELTKFLQKEVLQ